MRSRLSFKILVIALVLAGGNKAHASSLPVQDACSQDERWDLKMNSDLSEVFTQIPTDFNSSFDKLQRMVLLRRTSGAVAHNPLYSALAEYWIWRSVYQMGFVHSAEKGFSRMVDKNFDSRVWPAQTAAIQCIVRIHQNYPSMGFAPELIQAAQAKKISYIPGPLRNILLAQILTQELSRYPGLDPNLLITMVSQNDPISYFLRGIQSARSNSTIEAVKFLHAFLISDLKQPEWQKYKNFSLLLTGRIFLNSGNIDQAVQQFERVPPKSEWFTEAQVGRAWAYLKKNRFERVVGAAYHFQLPSYSKIFSPDPWLAAMIAFVETCNYPQAWKALNNFKKTYLPAQQWLQSHSLTNLYPEVLAYIRGEKRFPEILSGGWIASPVFMSSQEELNLIIDERKQNQQMVRRLAAVPPAYLKRNPEVYQILKDVASDGDRQLAELEAKIIARINSNFEQRSQLMLVQLQNAIDNAHLLEVEVISGGGEVLVQRSLAESNDKGEEKRVDSDVRYRNPVFRWGKKLIGSKDNRDVWSDEIGLFQAELTNKCKTK